MGVAGRGTGPGRGGLAAVGLAAMVIPTLAGCGGTAHKKARLPGPPSGPTSTLALSIADSGTATTYTVPASARGGLVTVTLANRGRVPHSAQLVRIAAGHTVQQALAVLGRSSGRTPAWVFAEGGLGPVPPGQTGRAALNLPAGVYLVADLGGPRSGPPAYSHFTVTRGANGPLPATPLTITAAQTGKDRYKWRFSGPLTYGATGFSPAALRSGGVTFVSRGKQALHLIAVARLTGNPTRGEIIRALSASTAAPPPFVDPRTIYNTAAIDGGKSQTTPLSLVAPGRYIFYCPLTDRTGGKRHFAEGLLTTVTVR